MKKEYLLLIIVGIAILLRFIFLGRVPISPDWDEAALGYNAYSIMETGRDEYGKFLPIVLRSFDDYKPGLYAYFIIPFIKLFGLAVFSVRFPSALFGSLTVIATFYIVRYLFYSNKEKDTLALIATFLLAISPWHLQFSRIGFESNVGLAFNVFAILFFLMGLRKQKFLFLSVALMVLNFYIYQSEKVFTPLIVFALLIIFRQEIASISKKLLLSCALFGFVILIPFMVYTATNNEAFARAKGVSIFSDQTNYLKNNVLRIQQDKTSRDYIGLILDNRRIEYAKSIFSGYMSHFDLNWLFLKGDISRHHAPGMGLLYVWELPFLLVGFYSLLFGNYSKKSKLLIFSWFFLAPIPASITSGVPHAVRTLNFLPTFQIFTALGLFAAFTSISKTKIKYVIFTLYVLFFIFNISYYLDQYFIQQNYFNAPDWQYGYQETAANVKKIESKYKKIVVSNKPPLDQSYMFFLFYLKYPPKKYQEETVGASGGFKENHHFEKYEFRPINWDSEKKDGQALFVGIPGDFPNDTPLLYNTYYPNGNNAIEIVNKK